MADKERDLATASNGEDASAKIESSKEKVQGQEGSKNQAESKQAKEPGTKAERANEPEAKAESSIEPVVKASEHVKKETGIEESGKESKEELAKVKGDDEVSSDNKRSDKNSDKGVDKAKSKKARKKSLKKLRKWLIIIGVVALILFIIVRYVQYSAGNMMDQMGSVTSIDQIERMDIADTISTTGTIQSKDVRTLTSALAGVTIEDVNYEVGDIVQKGAVVVAFSREDINKKINDLQDDINEASALQGLSSEYRTTEHLYDYGTASYNNYSANYRSQEAYESLQQAKRELDRACADKSDYDGKYQEAQQNIDRAKNEYDEYNIIYQVWLRETEIPSDPVEYAEYLYVKEQFQTKVNNLSSTYTEYKSTIDTYKPDSYVKAIENAQTSVNSAQRSYENTLASETETNRNSANSIITSDYNYARENISAGDSVESLQRQMEEYEKKLDDYVVYAPITGLVTEVNAQEGNGYQATSGVLMTIQDINTYEVTTQIDEYDIPKVQLGQRVVIMTDATGDAELEGVVSFISPTATTSQSGNTYKVNIDIQTENDYIMLGMSARLNIIIEQHDQVLAVRYDAIETDENGDSIVYVVKDDAASNDATEANTEDGILVVGLDGSSKVTGVPENTNDNQDASDNKASGSKVANEEKKQSFISFLIHGKQEESNNSSDLSLNSAAKKVKVNIGIEGDYYTEISSSELSEGTSVLVNSESGAMDPFAAMYGGMGGEMYDDDFGGMY